MVSLTAAAAEQIHKSAADTGAEGMSLRVAAHYDETAHEMHYGIGFDDKREQDQEIEAGGISLLVSPLSREAVEDLTIDYVEISPGDFRFIFYRSGELAKDGAAAATPAESGGCACRRDIIPPDPRDPQH